MRSRLVWIADLYVSDRTAVKIRSKHGIDPAAVRAAVLARPVLGRRVRDDRGTRLMVRLRVNDQLIQVVMYPAASDEAWNLASAYVVIRKRRA